MKKSYRVALAASAAMFALTPAGGNHSWSNYHWASPGELNVTVVRSVTPQWNAALDGAISDWEKSRNLSLAEASGETDDVSRKRCQPIAGKIRVCNAAYGQRQWIGLATIWLSDGHIGQAITQLNDSYFNMTFYNTPEWRAAVTCQEIAHDFGLDHQDENFDNVNLGSCMDYSRNPAGGVYNGFDYGPSNESPNRHDYDQLATIYNHDDGFTTATAGTNFGVRQVGRRPLSTEPAGESPSEWGRAVSSDAHGRPNIFVKDLGGGQSKVTHVLWAVDARVQ